MDEHKFDELVSQEWGILESAKTPDNLTTFLKISGYLFEDFFNYYEEDRIRKAALNIDLLPKLQERFGVDDTFTLLNEYFPPIVMDEVIEKLN